jgi:hypothetical protein
MGFALIALGFMLGCPCGIILGFIWYERKCGLFADHSGKRAAAIRFELDDVMERCASRQKTWDRRPEKGESQGLTHQGACPS